MRVGAATHATGLELVNSDAVDAVGNNALALLFVIAWSPPATVEEDAAKESTSCSS